MNSVSLYKHVNSSLNPYRWAISLFAAILVSGLFATFSFEKKLSADKQVAKAVSPYLTTLIESFDRPEMLRVLQSIAETTHSDIVLVHDENVFASSRSLEELDRPFIKPRTNFKMLNMDFGKDQIVTTVKIEKKDSPKIESSLYIISPLLPSLINTIAIFVGVFSISILISIYSSYKMKGAIKRALKPMDQLHAEIKGLTEENPEGSSPIRIKELEEIRSTVQSTKISLHNAQDRLAEAKAKKLSAESYKQLIHDLHNPVAALRQMMNLSNDLSLDEDARLEASASIPRIADQILNQITAAKKNLEDEPIALRELNLIDCVKDSVFQVRSLGTKKSISLDSDFGQLNVPHDPALLKRAIVNLLENGLEAAEEQVRVTITKRESNAIIRICDDGAGMDEKKVSLYLQGRGQSGKANRQAFGLASTNHIVRSHGGKLIHRRSDLGGTSFEIRLEVV